VVQYDDTMKLLWLIAGFVFFVLGAIGAILPLLPTVPFLLLTAFCFARSSDRLHFWLINHRIFGPPIVSWQEDGIISRRAKVFASVSILATFGVSLWISVGPTILIIQFFTLTAVSVFILSRPEVAPSKFGTDHQVDPESHTEQ